MTKITTLTPLFLISIFCYGQNKTEISLGYFSPYGIQPGVNFGANFDLKNFDFDQANYQLFLKPQLGFFSFPNVQRNLSFDLESGFQLVFDYKRFSSMASVGIGYIISNQKQEGTVNFWTGEIQNTTINIHNLVPTINISFKILSTNRFGYYFQTFYGKKFAINNTDVAFRKGSNKNILGLFPINEPSSVYTNMNSDQEVIDYVIILLDQSFEGKASLNYVNHLIQNWSAEPFIQGAYSYNFSNGHLQTVEELKKPVENKIFFAGEALSYNNQAMVHGACEAGYAAVESILTNY